MKRNLFLLVALLIGSMFMTACNWRLQSPVVKVTPEPTRMVELAPTPTPEPTGPAIWAPREDPELDKLFFNANYALGTDTNTACDGTPTEAPAHASFDASFPDWVEEKYPEGLDISCPAYNAWQVCQNATNPVACEMNVLNALGHGDFFSQEYFEEQVEEALADNGHDNLGPEPTATPKATETPMPTAVPTSEPVTDTVDLLVTEYFTANIPAEVVTIKVNTTGGWEGLIPPSASHILDESGVEGADELKDCKGNPSCIWTGGADHNQAQGPVVNDTIPEGSYWTAWADSFTIVAADGTRLEIPSCGSNCSIGIVLRGWHLETNEDRHLPIEVTQYGAPGAMKYTRYPVPAGAGQFFSSTYFTSQGLNALANDNCGVGLQDGEQDCDRVLGYAFDYNDKSMVVMELINGQWVELYTNITGHGRD